MEFRFADEISFHRIEIIKSILGTDFYTKKMNEFKSWVDGKLLREWADVYNNNNENKIYFSKNQHATTRNRPNALNFNHSLAIYYS